LDCSCIKGNFDFTLDNLGCDTILIEDMSDWMNEDYYELPTTYDVEVLTPGKKVAKIVQIKPDQRNRFSPSDFGQGGKYFLDGIYCFTTTSCGVKYTRNKAVVCAIECCLNDLISKSSPDTDFKEINRIKLLTEGIRTNAELGKLNKANELYDIVQKFLRRLNCNCK